MTIISRLKILSCEALAVSFSVEQNVFNFNFNITSPDAQTGVCLTNLRPGVFASFKFKHLENETQAM